MSTCRTTQTCSRACSHSLGPGALGTSIFPRGLPTLAAQTMSSPLEARYQSGAAILAPWAVSCRPCIPSYWSSDIYFVSR